MDSSKMESTYNISFADSKPDYLYLVEKKEISFEEVKKELIKIFSDQTKKLIKDIKEAKNYDDLDNMRKGEYSLDSIITIEENEKDVDGDNRMLTIDIDMKDVW